MESTLHIRQLGPNDAAELVDLLRDAASDELLAFVTSPDEAFLVIDGELRIDFREGSVTIGPGELYVVAAGVEHKPFAANETRVLVIEPRGVVNTGDSGGEMTAEGDTWI